MEVVLVEQISNLKVELIVWFAKLCQMYQNQGAKSQKVNSFQELAHWRVIPLACIWLTL